VVHHAPVVLFAVDRDGIITLSEGAALAAMGFRSGELVGRSAYDLYKDNPVVLDNFRRTMDGESFTSVVELGDVTLETWLSPLRDKDGAITGVLGVSTDISDRLRLMAKMTQADRMVALGRLAAGVAHEINNPLTFLLEGLRLADELAADLEQDIRAQAHTTAPATANRLAELRAFLAEAAEGAGRVRSITRDLRALSRPDDDSLALIKVNQSVLSAVKLVAKRTRSKAPIQTELGELSPVLANEARLVQVFVNLLLNAADVVPGSSEGNEIRVTTRQENGAAIIEVRDNGPGVPADLRDRIFEPFFTTKLVGEGTGLGLFVSRNLVDALGGTISVEDVTGGGALFRVQLPTYQGPAAPPVAEPETVARTRPPLRRSQIMIVDDDAQVAKLLRLSLIDDCEVSVFASGRAALDHLLGGARYDLIFCDLMMDDLSGMDLYEALKLEAPGRERELIFMSGGVFDRRVSDFLRTVSNDFIDKPFDIREQVRRRLATTT
jgi:PAS domain S-box-containing protein